MPSADEDVEELDLSYMLERAWSGVNILEQSGVSDKIEHTQSPYPICSSIRRNTAS